MAMVRMVAEELRAVLRGTGRLVLPRECAGCGRPDRALCPSCERRLGPPVRCEHLTSQPAGGEAGTGMPVWAVATYAGAVRHAILAWKSGGRPDLAAPLTGALERAATELGPVLACGDGGGDVPLLVVPAPSAGSRRRRGRFVVGELADAVGRGVASAVSRPVAVVDPLRRAASAGHLLDAAARGRDRARAVRCLTPLPAAPCVLVDDVVTTGATLAACSRVLAAAGGHVVGAVTLAVTPPPGAGLVELSALSGEPLRDRAHVD